MKKIIRVQKQVIIPCCEGEAESNLFSFLKVNYSNKQIKFNQPHNLKGFTSLDDFKRKYIKHVRAQNLQPPEDFVNVGFVYIFDDDLPDSPVIKDYLEERGHQVQLITPNVEGMMLSIVGQRVNYNNRTEAFRAKCKDDFRSYFHCDAHFIKEQKLRSIFNSVQILENKLPVLYHLFVD